MLDAESKLELYVVRNLISLWSSVDYYSGGSIKQFPQRGMNPFALMELHGTRCCTRSAS